MKVFRLLSFSFFFAVLCQNANATLIDFEGVVAPTEGNTAINPYIEDDFILSDNVVGADGIFGATSGPNTNGSAIYGWCAYCGTQTITLSHTGGLLFSFLSLDAAFLELQTTLTQSINITGFFNGGGSIFTTVELANSWATTLLAGFTSLIRVEFTAEQIGSDPSTHANLAFDNLLLRTNDTNAIPEPGTLAMFSIALLALMSLRRKNS